MINLLKSCWCSPGQVWRPLDGFTVEIVGKLSQVTLELLNDAHSIPLSTDTPHFSSNHPDTTTPLLHVTGASDFFQAEVKPGQEPSKSRIFVKKIS